MSQIQKRNLDEYKVVANKALSFWGYSGEPVLIRNGENVIYKLLFNNELYCIRITSPDHRSFNQIGAELDWMSYLSQCNISLAEPLKSLNQQYLCELREGNNLYYVAIFKWANGALFKKEDNWNPAFIKSLGQLMGEIHQKTVKYNSSGLSEKRKIWEESRHIVKAEEILKNENANVLRAWLEAKAWYDSLQRTDDSYGLAHLDIHTGNFHIVDNTKITLFDFDDSAYCFFAYDICVSLMSFSDCGNDKFSYQEAERAFLKSYLKAYKLPQIWLDRIPCFRRLRRLEMYSWVNFMYGANKEDRHIDYLQSIEDEAVKTFKFI